MVIVEALRRAWGVLPPARRRSFLATGGLVALAGAGDLLAIAVWYPFLRVLLDPASVHDPGIVARLYAWSGSGAVPDFQVCLGAVVIGVLVASAGLNLVTEVQTTRFGWGEKRRLSLLVLGRFLRLPHPDLIRRSSAEMGRDAVAHVDHFVDIGLGALFRIASSSLVAGSILVGILATDPWLAAASGAVTGAVYAAIYAFVQRKLRELAQASHGEAYRVTQAAGDALGMVKEARCPPERAMAGAGFRERLAAFNEILCLRQLYDEGPTPLALSMAQLGILLGCAYAVTSGDPRSQAHLGLLAVALARLIPEAKALYRGVLELRHVEPVSIRLAAQAREAAALDPDPAPVGRLVATASVRFEAVGFRYRPDGPEALSEVTLELPARGFVALVGPTGGGKTTLADLLTGVLAPTRGRLLVDDRELDAAARPAWRAGVGYVPQTVFLSQDTIRGNVAFGVDEADLDEGAVARAIESAGLAGVVADLPEGDRTVVGERGLAISGGQRQRIGIARALYRDPGLLVLDEATSALDPETEAAILRELVRLSADRLVVLVSHRLESVATADLICLVGEGRVRALGTWNELQKSSPVFRAMVAVGRDDPMEAGVAPGQAVTGMGRPCP